ncbi:IS110 family transposase [Lacticaseibacillus porcinae]|uniref:IS110 family transposase n=1 Tax=Lacticaseibacillus porcinae TaxID=1123687 RepID=UPI000F7A9550|nr:IS110 family transposase [Lacticaseibacillus porcinae]
MECIFGIDVSKATANVAVLVDETFIKEFKITSDIPGYQALEDELNSFTEPQLIFESTGIYSRSLRAYLQRNKWQYTEINPLRAKIDMEGFRHDKTDALDARGLALAMKKHHYKPAYQQAPVYSELHDLERTYQDYNEDVVRTKNRLHKALQLTFPELEHVLSTQDGGLYWHLVQRFAHPDFVLKYGVSDLADQILDATPKNMGVKRALKIANKLLDLAERCAPSVSSNAHAVRAVVYLAQEVERLDGLKNEIIDEMTQLSQGLDEVKYLLSFPGIGIKTVMCLIGELGDIRRFHSANAINRYIGIDLIRYESGDHVMKSGISKRGNAYARKILYRAIMNIVSAARYNPSNVSDYYQNKKRSSSTKRTKMITIGAMSRLIRTLYHLVINNDYFDPKTSLAGQ